MRCKCSMYGCRAATYNKIGYLLNFHRFPKDPARQKVWKEICKNPKIMNKSNKNLWLCSMHFEKSCYVSEYLKPDAVPTLNLPVDKVRVPLYKQAKNQTGTNSNKRCVTNSNLVYEDSGTSPPQGTVKSIEETARDFVKKENNPEESSTVCDDDDCESVNFSNSEDGSDNEEVCDRESPQPSCSDVKVKQEHDDRVVLTHTTPAVIPSPNLVEPVYQSLPKITKVTSIAEKPSTSRSAPISAVIDKVVEDNFEETEPDDCSTFTHHVKMRMRRFNPEQKVIAIKLISDIMFMADTMQLNLASAVVNPQAQAAQFSHAAQLDHTAQLAQTAQMVQVPQPVMNGFPKKEAGSFSAYVIDSDDDDGPSLKRKK